jgi:hypothetical protein
MKHGHVCRSILPLLGLLGMTATVLTDRKANSSPAVEKRVFASESAVLVRGQGNTLASIAREVNDPSLFRLEGKTAICSVAFTLEGELSMGPGEVLRMENPQKEWARRFVYLLGAMQFRECAIEGAFWIDIGPTAAGQWRDVRLVSGDNGDSGYPLVWFRSSKLDWQGGLIDAHPEPGIFTRRAIATRAGYYPGDVHNTLRGLTIRCREYALYDGGDRYQIDLTFERCDFVTPFPEDRAILASTVTLTDLGRSYFRLIGCRRLADSKPVPFDDIEVQGSAGVIEIEGADPAVHRVAHLTPLRGPEAGSLLPNLERRMRQAHSRLERLAENPRLAGSLDDPRRRLAYLSKVAAVLEKAEAYHPRDEAAVEAALTTVEETFETAPETLKPGSPYHPRPTPFPASLPGAAHVQSLSGGRVRVTSEAVTLLYDPNEGGQGYAAITDESRIRGRKLMGAYAPWGGPSPRHLSPTDSARMSWELAWHTGIAQAEGPVVGFTSEMPGPRRRARVSFIFFAELPDVILYHIESLQTEQPPMPLRARFAAYSRPSEHTYNGMRFWNDDRDGVVAYGDAGTERLFLSDPGDGVFVTSAGNRWYRPHLTRGVLAAQWNGANDWRRNPPCGWIVRRRDCEAVYTNCGGYYAQVFELYNPSRTDPDDLSHDLLWFEGGGLGCWENIFALDAAFNDPCRLAPLALRPGQPLNVDLVEAAGLSRPVEITILPRAFTGLQTDRPIYRGDCAALLLRNVEAHQRVHLGHLPISLRETGAGRFVVTSALPAPLRQVEFHLPVRGDAVRAVRCGDQHIETWSRVGDEIIFSATAPPGETTLIVETGEAVDRER